MTPTTHAIARLNIPASRRLARLMLAGRATLCEVYTLGGRELAHYRVADDVGALPAAGLVTFSAPMGGAL